MILFTAIGLVTFAAFVITIAAAMTPPRAPLWVAVLLLCILGLLQALPLK